jgi:superfamily II DNA or RNA helicase
MTEVIYRDYQNDADQKIRAAVRQGLKRILLVAPTGCHASGTGILMYDGSVIDVTEVKVGDLLMGPDSGPRKVMQLHHGREGMCRITPKKGEHFSVNKGHILSLIRTGSGDIEDISVSDWQKKSKTYKHIMKLRRAPVNFATEQKLSIDPYFVGVLIGDGCLTNGVGVCTPDKEIIEEIYRQAEIHKLTVRVDEDKRSKADSYYLTTGHIGGKPNPLAEKLKAIGLFAKKSGSKFIPNEYKTTSRSNRLSLLAGLIDTDGYINGTVDYVTKSPVLADDIRFLARSLGLAVTLSECIKGYGSEFTATYYRLCISGDLYVIPCRVERKKPSPRLQIKNPLLTGFSIEEVGDGEYYGFEVDRDHLYLTGDFIVHHNSGKTMMGTRILNGAAKKAKSGIWVAPRREIITQTSEKLDDLNCSHGIIMAGHNPSTMSYVQVASIQTYHRRKNNKNFKKPNGNVVIFDEAHLSMADSWQEMAADYSGAIIIGLTATPCRTDGKGLGSFWETLIEVTTVEKLMVDGWLVRPEFYGPIKMLDLSGVHSRGGDFVKEELGNVMDKPALIGDIVDDWTKRAMGMPTVLFASTVAHSIHCAEAFNAAGFKFLHLDGKTPKEERDEILGKLDRGEIDGVTNCQVLQEGWDQPRVSCLVDAQPTKSYGRFLQKTGRILRPCEGKTRALVIDHAGNVYRHGFPEEAGNWDLNDKTKITEIRAEKRERVDEPQTCRHCMAIYKGSICPDCGAQMTRKAIELNMEEGRLAKVKKGKKQVSSTAEKQKFWLECLFKCSHRNLKVGAAAWMFKKKVGTWPGNNLKRVPRSEQWQLFAKDFIEITKQAA